VIFASFSCCLNTRTPEKGYVYIIICSVLTGG
jgi:hypothetical protein